MNQDAPHTASEALPHLLAMAFAADQREDRRAAPGDKHPLPARRRQPVGQRRDGGVLGEHHLLQTVV
ncbi:MAG: hypothetical protein FWF96_00125 [Kiritimatiellaeota bacterium]|nr:hypothetical protein [Kiritimatiellota bacterium]